MSILHGRIQAEGEPLWLPRDLDVVVEWKAWSKAVCKGCGNSLSETMAPELQGAFEVEWVCCDGCRAREQAQDSSKLAKMPGHKASSYLPDERRREWLRGEL